MAFTALQFPLDKDQNQLPLWPDNDELAITSDNFFDQFVTFDAGDAATFGGEVFEDPPSPSILLDSLKSELSNPSSQPLDLSLDGFHVEAAARTTQPITFAPDPILADQVDPNSAVLAALAGDPILSNGSISDSELLRLEGISLKSSPFRGNVTTPSSPSHATLAPSSPRKHSRFVESVYATIRRAVHHPKPAKQEQYQPIDMTSLDTFFDDPRSGLDIFDLNYDEFADPIIPIKQEPMDSHGLPLSPPLTGRIPNEHQHSLTGFVTGHLDDPFCDNLLNTPTTIHSAKHHQINTPMSTPVINSETFLHNQVMTPLNTNMGNFRHPQKAYRSTSSAEWPMEGLLTDVRYSEDVNIWSSAPSSALYVVDNGSNNMASPNWWETPQSEILHPEPLHHQTTSGGGIHSNALHNISMHSQQADLPYEYNAELSGLMIHMPQPRAPPASVLSSDLGEQLLATPTLSSSNYHLQSTPTMSRTRTDRLPQHNGKSYGHTDKRPRPRAPSSGARHHGAQTSPRKLHHSMSLGHLREESQSPSPMVRQHRHPQHLNGHHHANHQERQQQRRSSLTIRKQRSFTRRPGGEPRTPVASTSATFAATPTPGGGGGVGGLDFVNFTPSDKNQLMSGVAPSGSSKTKARREKEAQDREKEAQDREKEAQDNARQVREMAYKAVREVGGDLTKLSWKLEAT